MNHVRADRSKSSSPLINNGTLYIYLYESVCKIRRRSSLIHTKFERCAVAALFQVRHRSSDLIRHCSSSILQIWRPTSTPRKHTRWLLLRVACRWPARTGRPSCRTQGPGRRTAEGRLRLCLCCASPRVSTASREEESMGFYLASCVSHPFESIQRWKLSVLEMGRDRPNH